MGKAAENVIDAFIKALRDPNYALDLDLGESIITIDDVNKRVTLEVPKCSKKGKE